MSVDETPSLCFMGYEYITAALSIYCFFFQLNFTSVNQCCTSQEFATLFVKGQSALPDVILNKH